MLNPSSKPQSFFRRNRTSLLTGFVMGLWIGPCGNIAILFYFEGFPGISYFVLYPLVCLSGLAIGIIIGPFGGLFGTFIAKKLGLDKSDFIFSLFGSIIFLSVILLILYWW